MSRVFLNLFFAAACLTALSLEVASCRAAGGEDHGAPHAGAADLEADSDHASGANHSGHEAGHHDHVYTIWGDLSLWSFVAFIGFVMAIKKLGLWDLLLGTMAEREKAAWETLDAADVKLSQAETSLRKFRGQFEALDDTVRELLAEGRRDVEYTQSLIVKEAEEEAATAVGRATYEVERVKAQTLHSLFEMLSDRVVSATEASLRGRQQSTDQDRLIEATLSELSR